MKKDKEITKKDMEIIERKIDAINIKMINWKYDILNTMFKTRNATFFIFVILVISITLGGLYLWQ